MKNHAVTRRSLLRAAGPVLFRAAAGMGTAASLSAAGCATDDGGVEVFVMWSGAELDRFRQTVLRFMQETQMRVRIVPVGEQVRELLRARLNANNPPDLAIVPLPGLIREYARDGRVESLDKALGQDIPPGFNNTVTVDGRLYGLFVKAAHKSLFWYRPSALSGIDPPTTFSDLVQVFQSFATSGRPPLSMGAADYWVLTDWFENVLAGVDDGVTYERLVHDEQEWMSETVRTALMILARLWAIPGLFSNGPKRALLTQFEESVYEVFAGCRAAMTFEADFVDAVVSRLEDANALCEVPKVFRFPPINGTAPMVVGGDVAVLLKPTVGGHELIRWLANPRSFKEWIDHGGFLSPNQTVPLDWYRDRHPTGRPAFNRALATQIREAPKVLFDLSDQLGGRLSAGQGRGLPRILTDLFRAVSTPDVDGAASIDRSVTLAQQQLYRAARGN